MSIEGLRFNIIKAVEPIITSGGTRMYINEKIAAKFCEFRQNLQLENRSWDWTPDEKKVTIKVWLNDPTAMSIPDLVLTFSVVTGYIDNNKTDPNIAYDRAMKGIM